jgi:hypothetical protein
MYLLLGLLYVVLIVYEALSGPDLEERQPQEEAIPQVAQGLGD